MKRSPNTRRAARAGAQTAKFLIRDNLRHRHDIAHAYLAAIRTAKREILIANSYFFPGIRFRMIDEQDRMRPNMRFFVGGAATFDLARPLRPTDTLHIVQALSGG